jgi:DeoR/GlpR family transcriptional regulator of sugar metabolism
MGAATSRELRQQAVVEMLRDAGSVTVAELGRRLGVAEMTIRRDLEILETAGVLQRFHGGARLVAPSAFEPPMSVRERTNAAGKRAIATRVAAMVEDGETVIIDGGSTGIALAQALLARSVTVCPLSLRVAWELTTSVTVDLLIPPGSVRRGELSLGGAETVEFLSRHHFDRYLLTASAFSVEAGFTEWNLGDAAVKRASIQAARRIVAAVDGTKFGRSAFVEICPVARPDVLVLDQLDPERTAALRAAARDVVLAEESGEA